MKKLPLLLTKEEKESLLKCFGAYRVDVFPLSGKMRTCAIAHFNNKEEAGRALMKLHQLEILGCHLTVEYAHDNHLRSRDVSDARWKCKTLPEPDFIDDKKANPISDSVEGRKMEDKESSESELSSDDDEQYKQMLSLPQKRPPAPFKSLIPTSRKKKPISIEVVWKKDSAGGENEPVAEKEGKEEPVCLSEEERILQEIHTNRLTAEEQQEFTVFRNYNPGTPSSKLYLKNLSRHIQQQDLERIFGIFATDMTSFSVKLMKTGRMKDQAFVSYSTDSEAVRALQEANGFKFKEKPMVVLFSNSGN